ncbi:MAG: HipA domain-containing protein [Aquabacterium sp.]|jgi:hypothetical protein|uniref:HipA domain-containing protein n=1 Tax=Aquabacterium sp. TaxID=1872578 RepID=UPI003BB15CBC
MKIDPLVQTSLFDVSGWTQDAEFGVFPQGARAKLAYFAPDNVQVPEIRKGRRYLFKRSKKSYPDQYWGEVVAYRIGCLIGVTVPPAFGALNSETGVCAALIEWFYEDGVESFIHAGDFLQRLRPDFEREVGADHNMADNTKLLSAWAKLDLLKDNWSKWWAVALAFDALIGNTDRHQDNWGLILATDVASKTRFARLSPCFDNGTSLGHERFVDRIAGWRDHDVKRYIEKGKHHVRWTHRDEGSRGHAAMLASAVNQWPAVRANLVQMLGFSKDDLIGALEDLLKLDEAPRDSRRLQHWRMEP